MLTGRWRTRRGWFFGRRFIEVEDTHSDFRYNNGVQDAHDTGKLEYAGQVRVWRRAEPQDLKHLHPSQRVRSFYAR